MLRWKHAMKKLFIFKIYLNLKYEVNQIYFKQTYEYTLLFNKTNGGEKKKEKDSNTFLDLQ